MGSPAVLVARIPALAVRTERSAAVKEDLGTQEMEDRLAARVADSVIEMVRSEAAAVDSRGSTAVGQAMERWARAAKRQRRLSDRRR